jgi:hypothetical protein
VENDHRVVFTLIEPARFVQAQIARRIEINGCLREKYYTKNAHISLHRKKTLCPVDFPLNQYQEEK